MPLFTTIQASDAAPERIDAFGGYNHNMKIADGEFFDMTNLSSDHFPLMGTRSRRGYADMRLLSDGTRITFYNAKGMTVDAEGNIWLAAQAIYPEGSEHSDDSFTTLYKIHKSHSISGGTAKYGVVENFSEYANALTAFYDEPPEFILNDREKMMFATGDTLYIFPDKLTIRTAPSEKRLEKEDVPYIVTYAVSGKMNATLDIPDVSAVIYEPCDSDGNAYTGQTVSAAEPSSPDEGDIWVDTSGKTPVWKKRSSERWVSMQDVYVKITMGASDISNSFDFEKGDGIQIDITGSGIPSLIRRLSGSHILIKDGTSGTIPGYNEYYMIITGLIGSSYTQEGGTFRAERKIPDMDFIIMAQNRLWGCRYEIGDGDSAESINEIYASKLGDFNNWGVYQGISTDSYAASVGTPGKWTGAVNIGGYPVFFKEDHYHKVYVSSSGAHQILDKPCHGVQDGCGGSVAVVGDICYFKSKNGVMAFDGTSFSNIGSVFGSVKYKEAHGGAAGDKYYLSVCKENSTEYSLFAYDTVRGIWHREDAVRAMMFCTYSGDSFFLEFRPTTEDWEGNLSINILSTYDIAPVYEDAFNWEAVTGLQGYDFTGQKYISRFNFRMQLPRGSEMDVFIEYNSSGIWHHEAHIKGTGTNSFVIPVRPRRCDHFRIKLSGKGDVRIYSFSKYFQGGSDIV